MRSSKSLFGLQQLKIERKSFENWEKIIGKIISTCWNLKLLATGKCHAHWKIVINDWTYQLMTQSATKSSHNLQCFHSWKLYYQFRLNISLGRLENVKTLSNFTWIRWQDTKGKSKEKLKTFFMIKRKIFTKNLTGKIKSAAENCSQCWIKENLENDLRQKWS